SWLWERLDTADGLIVSMINTDAQARLLAGRLASRRPSVTLVFNAQPELMEHSRIGSFDARAFAAPEKVARVARSLQRLGIPLPPTAFVILSALGKVYDRIPADHPELAPLRAY